MAYKNQFPLKTIYSLNIDIKLRDVILRIEAQIKEKQYSKLLSTLMTESKRCYFTSYFQNNLDDLKST